MIIQDSFEHEQLLNEFTRKFHMERSKAEEVCNDNRDSQQDNNFFCRSWTS